MWSKIFLCLLVGLTNASNNPGWKDNAEYVYNVHGRTFASLHGVSNKYSGISFKSILRIQTGAEGKLCAQISEPLYSPVHSELYDGWNTFIPNSELSWKPLPMSLKPFQIEMTNGVITDLIVSKNVPNWEVNIIKGIVSQFQLNTNGNDLLFGQLSSLPENQQNSALFKIMEDTVTGNTETLYEINPLPDYVFQSRPQSWKYVDLKDNEEVIEVVKHKNYSNNVELPFYVYGFVGKWEPATNQMGHFFVRDSTSRALLTGNLKRYTVQNSYTVNQIIVSPTLVDKQKGSVISMLNVSLENIQTLDQKIAEVSEPVRLGNLVYTYESPNSNSNEVRVKQSYHGTSAYSFANERHFLDSNMASKRLHRSVETESSQSSEEYYYQPKPHIDEAPESPLLPYFVGYEGRSLKQHVNVVEVVEKLAKEIGSDLQNPASVLNQNTLDKFSRMTSLIRLMEAEELQRITSALYSSSDDETLRDTWVIFRDGVAESGTGPAFLEIQNWILSKKLEHEEASQVISTMTNAVRQPTFEYMKAYFELIQNWEVQSQWPLNDTALIAYTSFVHKVYFSEQRFNQYPVKSFGRFDSEEGKQFIYKTVIPYFSQKLQDAIHSAETHKIHAFIRALGNIGVPEILVAYEPYLEGDKQASQYQRLLMVLSMNTLAKTYPAEARSVLFKIYQNSGESQEVRVAAVYQIMRTTPPADMLQLMASYTNIDQHEHVNAAVKSSIKSLAATVSSRLESLRSAARAAEPLLTSKVYGPQYGLYHLRVYFIEELKIRYRESVQHIGSEDAFYPKGVQYSWFYNLGGVVRQFAQVQAMISSFDELIHVGEKQTESYIRQEQEQKRNAAQQTQNPWSSQHIARLLNIKSEEREQLEGNLYAEFGAFISMWSFDNRTVEELPEVIRKWEDEYKSGKHINYMKLVNQREMALSFPTEMGLPFSFTYETPTVIQVQGSLKVIANPQVSQDDQLQVPDTIQIQPNVSFTLNAKAQGILSFVTPFDHQQYSSGYDKHMQLHLDLTGDVNFDLKTMQMQAEIEPKIYDDNVHLFHYSTWPYTSINDITNFHTNQWNRHHIRQENLHRYNKTFGQSATGIALRVEIEHQRRFVDIPLLGRLFCKHGFIAGFFGLWDNSAIQYGQMNVTYLPEQSWSHKYIVNLGYGQKYGIKSESASFDSWKQSSETSEPLVRQQGLMGVVASGINSVGSQVLDASVEFQGDKNIKYTITGAFAQSTVDPKSRILLYAKKSSDNQDVEPYEVSFESQSEIPNTNELDLEYSMDTEPKADSWMDLSFGPTQGTPSKIKAELNYSRSEERKQFLSKQSLYQQCQHEMREGNKQLPACANVTMDANLLDRVTVELQYDNIKDDLVDAVRTTYEVIRFKYWPTLEVTREQTPLESNQIKMQASFDPDLRSVNVSVETQNQQSIISSIWLHPYAKEVFVLHPVYHLRTRLMSKYLEFKTYRPMCVVDQTRGSTFNNRTFPTNVSNHWTVMFQYVPKHARDSDQPKTVEEQLQDQIENYVVLVRSNSNSNQNKDVRITLSTPETEFRVVDIFMTPNQNHLSSESKNIQVSVNSQQVTISEKESFDVSSGFIQIYALPNKEVKVVVNNAFYLIYDGYRVRLSVISCKFRDTIRGLCGPFNDEHSEDFLTAEHCIARDEVKFVRSFEIEGQEGRKLRKDFSENSLHCIEKQAPVYVDVVSDIDSRRQASGNQEISSQCNQFQTRYVQKGGEICFTLRALPACASTCRPNSYVTKHVPVHCIRNSNVAQLWRAQIDNGGSPNFSNKQSTKSISMQLPESCSKY